MNLKRFLALDATQKMSLQERKRTWINIVDNRHRPDTDNHARKHVRATDLDFIN